MLDLFIPLPEGYFINEAKIIKILEDRIGTGNRDAIYNPDRKDGIVMKIAIAADDDSGQRYGTIIKAKGNLDGFENLSRVPLIDEKCYIMHKKEPFYDEGKQTIAYDISAIFDLERNIIYYKPMDDLIYQLQQSTLNKLNIGASE